MTAGDALLMAAFMTPIACIIIAIFWLIQKENTNRLRIRADLLKAGIDPDRLDKGEDE